IDDAQLARPALALTSLVVLCLMILGGSLLPVPYVIERPGPAIDVLGEYEEEEILVIDGAETHQTDGALMMTTVSVDGGPGYRVTPVEVVAAWFDSSKMVLPKEVVFPEEQTREQTTLANTAAMSSSQQGAVAVALDELGIEYRDVVMVAGVQADGAAEGTLEGGDVIVSVTGETAGDVKGFQRLIEAAPDGEPIPMTVRRDGQELTLEVPTALVDGTPRMGVMLAPGHEFPMDVQISVGSIGGPSAGMIFSLSVYDQLTPGALTGGRSIAGTGTSAAVGAGGPIGGIRQKMVGAEETGDVVGHVPDELDVVAVSTFEEALTATETIADTGSIEDLPTCEDVTTP
ncbi:MAG: PDZ domain-containing protein, partial [Brachybacterium sp.]|nr:PDZ domain-containing protein [Brachybacterium sp.]